MAVGENLLRMPFGRAPCHSPSGTVNDSGGTSNPAAATCSSTLRAKHDPIVNTVWPGSIVNDGVNAGRAVP